MVSGGEEQVHCMTCGRGGTYLKDVNGLNFCEDHMPYERNG